MRRRLVALGAAAALLLAGCSGDGGTASSGGAADSEGTGTSLTIGEIVYPPSFDIDGYQISHYVVYFNAVFDTLIRQDGDGDLVPGLATAWEYDDSRTTLTLTLRDGIEFTDGTAFDADAVVANIEAFQATATPDLGNAQQIAAVTASDPTHVVITLAAPDPSLTRSFTGSLGFMASPASFTNADVKTNPVGTGPYTLDSDKTVVGSSYVFQKNPDYWDDSYHVYDTLTINCYEGSSALLNALQGGQLDAAAFSDFSSLDRAESAGYTVNTSQIDWAGLILFDRDGVMDAPLKDVRVRQAINYAFDRDGILEAIERGHGTVTSSVFGERTAGHDASLDSYYDFDPEKARELLAEAGYADGFTLTMPSASFIAQNLLTTVQQQLADIGITVTYTDTGNNFGSDLVAGKFSSTWMQLASADDWQFAQLALLPNATLNAFHTETADANALLETMQTGDEEEASAAAKELNAYVTENAWFAPLFRIDNLYLSNDKVKITMAADNVTPYLYLIQPAS